jgi:hypothetical protein
VSLIQYESCVPFRLPFRKSIEVRQLDEQSWLIAPRDAAVFLNWIPICNRTERCGLAHTRLVDHTVMARLRGVHTEVAEDAGELVSH